MSIPLVFVVDKNPIHRNLIRYRLESGRFARTETFPSGEECLYRIHHGVRPDFIITSFFNGGADGFTFLQEALAHAGESRIIFFDDFSDHDLPRLLVSGGAADFVAKTRDPDAGIAELVKNIRYMARTGSGVLSS